MLLHVIDRPAAANALDEAELDRLTAALASAESQRAPLVIAAQGRHFCAGFDRDLLANGPAAAATLMFELLGRLARRTVPAACIVNGAARGAGVMLAAGCDLVIADPAASFGLPELTLGIPSFAAVELLSLRMAPARAFALVAQASAVDCRTAAGSGLVDEVLDAAAALPRVEAVCAAAWSSANLAAFAALRAGLSTRTDAALKRAAEATHAWLASGGDGGPPSARPTQGRGAA